ncbi:microtubule-associated tyrosine carboxypeptidase-like isoform X2 [Lineus longissimus]
MGNVPSLPQVIEPELLFVESTRNTKRMRDSKNLPKKVNIITSVTNTPSQYVGKMCPTNLLEQKERFLKYGIVPKFNYRGSSEGRESITKKIEIKFEFFHEAMRILEMVKSSFGTSESYISETFGKRIDHIEASTTVAHYLSDNNLDGCLKIYWSEDLTSSARLSWRGPCQHYNKPESRVFTLMFKNSNENPYLREHGIRCVMDHEIGTHFFRAWNDGLQPWFSDRKKFGLVGNGSNQSRVSEEGFAAINTVLHAKNKYLYLAALAYYTACMSVNMTFRQLFEHLETYVSDPEHRWKLVMRVKRGLADSNNMGGFGLDQCYFEGAVNILKNIDNIDFLIMVAGKICWGEVPRVKRLARTDCIKVPLFMKNMEAYVRQLKHIANVNHLADYSLSHNNKRRHGNGRPKTVVDRKLDRSLQSRPTLSEAGTPQPRLTPSMSQSRPRIQSGSSPIPFSRKSFDSNFNHNFNKLSKPSDPPNIYWRKGGPKRQKSVRKTKKLLKRRQSNSNLLLYDKRVQGSNDSDSDDCSEQTSEEGYR